MSERSQRSAAASRGSRAHSSSQLRRRAGIRIRDIDDPDVEAEITVLGSDGSVQNSLVWSQRRAAQAASASGNSRAAASEASSLPSASALYEVNWDADLYGELSNEQRAPVVLASEGRVMLLIEDSDGGGGGGGGGSSSGVGRHYHFVELAALQARDGSEGLAARCTCNNVGKLAGVMMQGGGIVALSSVGELASLIQPCAHGTAMASALQLGPLLQPNPAGCRQLQQIAAAATQRLSGTVDADGAVIVMVELAGGAAAVRCPGEDEDDWAVVVNWDDPTKPARCLRCKQGACRHVQIVGSKTEEPTTLSRVRFDGELEGFLDGARQQRRLVGLSQQGPIPELTAGGEMSDPTCAAVIAARCSSPLPTVLLPDSSACPCGGAHGWQRVLASPASGQPARLFDVTRCTEVEVFSLRCLNPACQAVRQYDGFADCIINVDNRALFTWELCISYCNEFATRAKVTFFGFWRSSLARYALAGQLESVVCEALLASGSLRTKFQDGVMDFITMQKLPYASEMACCDGSTCCADGMAMGIALSKACLSDESWRAPPDAAAVMGSRFADRVPIPNQAVRKQLQQFAAPQRRSTVEPRGLATATLQQLCSGLRELALDCVAELCTPADAAAELLLPQPHLREFLYALGTTA